jgi:peptidoglycan hydrolase-like protein with peptidoglycan-binding domain
LSDQIVIPSTTIAPAISTTTTTTTIPPTTTVAPIDYCIVPNQLSTAQIVLIQRQLKNLGFFSGLPLNGKWSPRLFKAIRSFEEYFYVPSSSPGMVKKSTLNLLGVAC